MVALCRSLTRGYHILPDLTRTYQNLQEPTRTYTIPDPTRTYQTSPDEPEATRTCQILPDPPNSKQILLDPTRTHLILLEPSRTYKNLLDPTRIYQNVMALCFPVPRYPGFGRGAGPRRPQNRSKINVFFKTPLGRLWGPKGCPEDPKWRPFWSPFGVFFEKWRIS